MKGRRNGGRGGRRKEGEKNIYTLSVIDRGERRDVFINGLSYLK